jgi:hypothetical protein
VDEDDGVLVVDDLDLRLGREGAGDHEPPEPATLEAGHQACDLIGVDRACGVDAFGLAEYDQWGVVLGCSGEAPDEVPRFTE